MKKIVLVFLVGLSQIALADSIRVDITPPEFWSDGSAVVLGDVGRYHVTRDCGGDIAEVYTEQPTHTFANVPDGNCDVTASAIGQNGKEGAQVIASVVAGLSMGAPGVNLSVDSQTSLGALIAGCEANEICESIVITP
jgi:hypothetical protein